MGTSSPVRVSLASTDPVMRPGLSVRVEVVRVPERGPARVPHELRAHG